ncbi:MAG: hypothetical protein AAF950_06860 [Pseudomonadota bacterium]
MQDRTSYSYRGDTPGGNPDMYQVGGMARDAFKRSRGHLAPRQQDLPQQREWDEPKPELKPRSAQNVKAMKTTARQIYQQRRDLKDLDQRRKPETYPQDRKAFEAMRRNANGLIQKAQDQVRTSQDLIAQDQREASFRAQRCSPYLRQSQTRSR